MTSGADRIHPHAHHPLRARVAEALAGGHPPGFGNGGLAVPASAAPSSRGGRTERRQPGQGRRRLLTKLRSVDNVQPLAQAVCVKAALDVVATQRLGQPLAVGIA